MLIPAGVSHKRVGGSRDLLVVGAYPGNGDYDEVRPAKRTHGTASAATAKVLPPTKDPLYGINGAMKRAWRLSRGRRVSS